MTPTEKLPPQPRLLPALGWGWIAAPTWWLVQFQLRYALVPWAGRHDARGMVTLIGGLALTGAVALAIWAWRAHRKSTGEQPSTFLATCGACIATLFALLIFAQVLPDFFIDPHRL